MILERPPIIERTEAESLELEDPSAFVWRDAEGAPRAVSKRRGRALEVVIPALGRLTLLDGEEIASAALFRDDPARLLDAYHRFALPIFLQARGFEVLHASAVVGLTGVVAFCGPSGSGKSTLAYALGARGFEPWADDVVVLSPAREAVRLPFRHRLSADALAHIEPRSPESPTPFVGRALARFCLLERAEVTEISRLAPSDAFVALYRQSLAFDLSDAGRNEAMLASYFELAERIPVHRLRYRPSFDEFERLLTTVEETLLV